MTSVATPESPILETPKWFEALENKRKRPHCLAHDIGAGAPCLVCKEGCKGLNLHFWRKLCIECKCRKEDHDVVEEEDYAQFEILFGAKKVKRTTLVFNTQNKTFDWIPPDVPQELAVDYLNALPQSKVPISDSEGAKHRKQQFEKQLPLHDVDPNACHDLTAKEMQEFQNYLDNLKNNVIGQGRVMKYNLTKLHEEKRIPLWVNGKQAFVEELGKAEPESAGIRGRLTVDKMAGVNAINSQKVHAESFPVDAAVKTDTIEQFQARYEYAGGQPSALHPMMSLNSLPDLQPMISQKLEKNQNMNNLSQMMRRPVFPSGPKPFTASTFPNFKEEGKTENQQQIYRTPSGLQIPSEFTKLVPNFDHENNNENFRIQDNDCNKNSSTAVDMIQNSFQKSNEMNPLNFPSGKHTSSDANSDYSAYQPVSCDASISKDPLQRFNELYVSCDDVPFIPVQETQNLANLTKKKEISQAPYSEVQAADLVQVSLPAPPQTCKQCYQVLNPEDIVVSTDRGGSNALWHARCFVCDTCKELLVDLMYFFNKGKVYCGRHFSELMKIPRCFACDELIFVKEYTCAEGESFHVRHFCCFHCDEPLAGKQYVPKEGQPVCLNCFELKYGKKCRTCAKPITACEQRVSWKDLDFHASPNCFRCGGCLKSLLGGKFVVKNDRTFCSKECVQGFVH